ncbi:MAG: ferritin [Elusimicrobiota bacterium]
MINDKMTAALNDQITKEFYSAYLYMSMASYLEAQDLPGFAKWMRTQAQEELSHATIIFNYVCEQGSRAILGAIEAPTSDFKSLTDVFEHTLEHEKKVTASIHSLVDLAISERDHATKQFLEWFVKEQVEEEATAGTWLGQIKRVGDGNALFMMDKEAGARIFTVPAPLVGKL